MARWFACDGQSARTRNALDLDLIDAVEEACTRINRDDDVRAVIITGEGKSFCAGGNVKDMRDRKGLFGGSPAKMRDSYRRGIQRIPKALYSLDTPTIAAVNGSAIGAGLDLALSCDIRLAGKSSMFAESFVKLGIIPGDGGAWLLQRAVSLSRACEMIFTGDAIDAVTAERYGLVSQVVEDADLLPAALSLARRIAANPPHAVRMAKSLVREGQRVSLDTLLELSAALQPIAQHTSDHREAVTANWEKRLPIFKGEV